MRETRRLAWTGLPRWTADGSRARRGRAPRRRTGTSPARLLGAALLVAAPLGAQGRPLAAGTTNGPADLDSLVALAIRTHPTVHAADARVQAARARVTPAGTWSDPMLMAGIQNFPLSEPGFGDEMTMKMVGVSQTIPYPGRTRLRRAVAEAELAGAEARLRSARLEVGQRVRDAYYQVAYLDQALAVVEQSRRVLAGFVRIAEARYGVGTGSQQEVLQAGVELTRLADQAIQLAEQRRVAQARLNEALDRYSETPIPPAAVPGWIARAAAAVPTPASRFRDATLGARAGGSRLPSLQALEEMAVETSPVLAEHQAMIQAQAARRELARLEVRPDFDVSLQYGQRSGYADMVSATVSVPLPLRRRSRQDLGVQEATAELAAAEAERHEARNQIRLEVARLHSDLERSRTQLALLTERLIPQARASLESQTAGFQVGRVDLLALLEAQATLFNYETEYHRLLTEFAQRLAELERVVGRQVIS